MMYIYIPSDIITTCSVYLQTVRLCAVANRTNMCIYVCMYVCIYIYIYIYRERERDIDRETERDCVIL